MKTGELVAVKLGAFRGVAVRLVKETMHLLFSSPQTGIVGENLPGFEAVIVDPPEDAGRKLRLPVQYFQPIPYAEQLEAFLAASK